MKNEQKIVLIFLVCVLLLSINIEAARTQKTTPKTKELTLSGELDFQHYEYESGKIESKYYLNNNGKKLKLVFDKDPYIYDRTLLEVKGKQTGSSFYVSSYKTPDVSVASASNFPTTGELKTVVLLANFVNDRSEPMNHEQVNDKVFNGNLENSVNNYIEETSYDKAQVIGDVYPQNGDWYQLQVTKEYEASHQDEVFLSVIDLADNDVDFSIYDYIIIVFPSPNGVPSSTGQRSNVQTDEGVFTFRESTIRGIAGLNSGTTTHEFGHLLGLKHASGWECGGNTIGGSCQSATYLDYLDVMGMSSTRGHFDLFHKDKLGWLENENILYLDESSQGIYKIAPFEFNNPSEDKSLGIVIDTNSAYDYSIEFRRPIGYDKNIPINTFNQEILNGALIHINYATPSGVSDTHVLDMTPHTNSQITQATDFKNVVLKQGETFEDQTNSISISVLRLNDEYLEVCVNKDLQECITANPALPDSAHAKKNNRYLTFNPNENSDSTYIEVLLSDLPQEYSQYEGQIRYLGEVKKVLARNYFNSTKTNSRGSVRQEYVYVSKLQCTPHYEDWSRFESINAYGGEIIPGSTYKITPINELCESEDCIPSSLNLQTSIWGDVNDDNLVNSTDIILLVGGVKGTERYLNKISLQLAGSEINPENNIGINDLQAGASALTGENYNYPIIENCDN